MPINFLRTTGLIAALFAMSYILLQTSLYIAEQVEVDLSNFSIFGGPISWGVVVLAFRRIGQPLLQSFGNTVLSVILVVILATIPITAFEIGLHHYIDSDYKHRMAVKKATLSQQKMHKIEAERNVVFSNSSEEEYIEKYISFYSIKGLIRSQVISMLISSVLLFFLVLLLAPISSPVNDY